MPKIYSAPDALSIRAMTSPPFILAIVCPYLFGPCEDLHTAVHGLPIDTTVSFTALMCPSTNRCHNLVLLRCLAVSLWLSFASVKRRLPRLARATPPGVERLKEAAVEVASIVCRAYLQGTMPQDDIPLYYPLSWVNDRRLKAFGGRKSCGIVNAGRS